MPELSRAAYFRLGGGIIAVVVFVTIVGVMTRPSKNDEATTQPKSATTDAPEINKGTNVEAGPLQTLSPSINSRPSSVTPPTATVVTEPPSAATKATDKPNNNINFDILILTLGGKLQATKLHNMTDPEELVYPHSDCIFEY